MNPFESFTYRALITLTEGIFDKVFHDKVYF